MKIAVVHSSRFSSQERTRLSAAIVVELETGAVVEEAAAPTPPKADTEAEARVIAKVDVEAEEVVERREEVEVASVVGDVDEASRTTHRPRPLTQLPRLATLDLSYLVVSIFPCFPPKVLVLVHLNCHSLWAGDIDGRSFFGLLPQVFVNWDWVGVKSAYASQCGGDDSSFFSVYFDPPLLHH